MAPVVSGTASAGPATVKLLHVVGLAAGCSVALHGSSARADDAVSPDQPSSDGDVNQHRIQRTWLYADDASVAAPLSVVASSNASYTNVGSSPSRIASPYPNIYNGFAANTAQPGGMISAGGEVGLVPRLSVMAMGQLGIGGVDGVPDPSAGMIAGLRLRLSPSDWQNVHLALSAGYLREAWSGPVYDDDSSKWLPGSAKGDNGAWIQAAVAADVKRLRMAMTVHGEHVFWPGRDPLDVMAELGASYRVVADFRLGVEYVGQDLEETFTPGAEGGARHFMGPIASLQLLDERMSIVAGPAIGLSSLSPSFVGRVALSYGF
jgi:hypothetical protein